MHWCWQTRHKNYLVFASDWDASFARAAGLAEDRGATLGIRLKRFSMLVDGCVVTQINVEGGPGTIANTGAANMIGAL